MHSKSKTGVLRRAGYSLVEVLVAAGIIAMGVGAAVTLSAATSSQEEAGNNVGRAVAVAENAARMFRMGLDGNEIKRLLPNDPIIHSLAISESYQTISGVVMNRATIVLQFDVSPNLQTWDAGEWTGGPGGNKSRRTLTLYALRPTVRAGYN